MNHSSDKFEGSRGRSIYYQFWLPDTPPRALLLVVHGAGEYSGRYERFARFFVEQGYGVAALDYNGHGYSEGIPGHVESFGDYLLDLKIFHQRVRDQFTEIPTFLLGHSLGGLIGSHYLLQHQGEFAGCILSGAAIKSAQQPGRAQMWLLRQLATLTPRLGILKLDAAGVSRDNKVVRQYVADPLVYHGKMSARMLRELFFGMHVIASSAAQITLPMLILHGGEDAMTAPEGSRFLYQCISSTDKGLKIYPGLYHEIFNEPERAQVLDDILSWCEQRL